MTGAGRSFAARFVDAASTHGLAAEATEDVSRRVTRIVVTDGTGQDVIVTDRLTGAIAVEFDDHRWMTFAYDAEDFPEAAEEVAEACAACLAGEYHRQLEVRRTWLLGRTRTREWLVVTVADDPIAFERFRPSS